MPIGTTLGCGLVRMATRLIFLYMHAGGDGIDDHASDGLKLTAHMLTGLAAQAGLRVETFSLGPAAAILGLQATNNVCIVTKLC